MIVFVIYWDNLFRFPHRKIPGQPPTTIHLWTCRISTSPSRSFSNTTTLRATSHTRLRAHDHYASSTPIGGKGGAGPSLPHTTLEGPTEYVNAKWMESLHGFLHIIKRIMFHGHLDYFQKPPLRGRPNTNPRDHNTLNAHNHWFILLYHMWRPTWTKQNPIKIAFNWWPGHIWLHTTLKGPWPHYIILEVHWAGLRTHSFGLLQLHGHGYWLMHAKWPLLSQPKLSLPQPTMRDFESDGHGHGHRPLV